MIRSLLSILLAFMSASAMITRHDRADALYLELGTHYPMVGQIARMGGATLIAPEWAVTAAHVAEANHFRAPTVRFGNQEYGIAEVFIHPDWTPEGRHDIAVLKLAAPVSNISPAAIYAGTDEVGKEITFVGRGDWGTGVTGPVLKDGKRRAATNRIDSVDAYWIYFTLDSGDAATDLEGINGPGDSGTPTLLMRNDTTFIVGVSSWGSPGPQGPRSYGCGDAHTRVSSYAKWIREAMSGRTPGRRPQDIPEVKLPDTPAGKMVSAYVSAFNSDDENRVTEFNHTYRSSGSLAQGSDTERLQIYYRARDDFGQIELYKFVSETPEVITVQMATEIGAVLEFKFELEPEPPHGLNAVRVSSPASARE